MSAVLFLSKIYRRQEHVRVLFFAQNSRPQPNVCGAFLFFEISVYVGHSASLQRPTSQHYGVHSNVLDDKTFLAMLARMKLNSRLFSFSLLDELSGTIKRS